MKQALVAAAFLTVLTVAFACGPEFEVAVFSYAKHPDFPRTEYLKGKLGILQPTYARSYLVIAYRYLAGTGLSEKEQEQVQDYWKDRATGDWDDTDTDWNERWTKERNRIARRRVKPVPEDAFDEQTHAFYMNCAEDAFRTAYRTLQDRSQQFGDKSREVQEWLRGQDIVFSNCAGKGARVPPPAAVDIASIIRADRAYQVAAARLYAGQHSQAAAAFRRIAADSSSPWQKIAPYLVVRSLLREAESDKQYLVQVRAEGRKILANPSQAQLHGMTRVLMRRAGVLTGDPEYLHGLAADLTSPGQDSSMREELWDFTDLYDRLVGESLWGDEKKKWKTDLRTMRGSDLTDWIYTFQSDVGSSKAYAYERWHQGQSIPWLVAALAQANGTDPHAGELIEAANRIPPTSPAYLTVAFHRYRLMIEGGRGAETRDALDELMTGRVVPLPASSVNQLRGLRMLGAINLHEYLRFALRFPLIVTYTDDGAELPPPAQPQDWWVAPEADPKLARLDSDSIKVLNERTPFRILLAAAADSELPSHWRRDFALAVFTRALLLDNDAGVQRAAHLLEGQMQGPAGSMDDIFHAATPEERRFAAVFLLLHYPEARPYLVSGVGRQTPDGKIDNYRENWWPALDGKEELDAYTDWTGSSWDDPTHRSDPDRAAARVSMLSDADRSEARAEFERLVKTRSAANYLAALVVEFARAHPQDPRVPEALALSVRVARFTNADKEAWKETKAAFQLLHLRYPKNLWAKKTPIWFAGY